MLVSTIIGRLQLVTVKGIQIKASILQHGDLKAVLRGQEKIMDTMRKC
jgi:hypothetical protein